MKIYRDYDQAGLDAQYNCRAMVEDFDDHMATWVRLSEEARMRFDCRADLAYGEQPGERLDLFLPDGPGPHPLLAFIHGGYWRAMDKDVHAFPAVGFVPDGIAVASINYTLAPAADMDEIVRQCRAAVAWLWRHAADFGLDRDRLHVSGHSAGGHLTAMLLATDWPEFAPGLPADTVKTGAPISGLYDLEPIRHTYLNADVRLTPELIPRNSPVTLTPKGATAMVITAGALESDEFHRLQGQLVERWRPHLPAIDVVDMPGRHHFNVVTALAERDSALNRAIRARILG